MKPAYDIEEITRYLHAFGYSRQTIRSYLYGIEKFLLTNPKADQYKYKKVLEHVNRKSKDFKSPNTGCAMLAPIKKYYDYLIEKGIRNDHPCKSLILKRSRKDIINEDLFTTAELELLMERDERYEILRLKNQLLISLLIHQGLTAGEVVNMKVHHVDLDSGTIYVKESRKLTRRHLDLQPKQYKIIDHYINNIRKETINTETDSLLVGKLGTPITIDDINYLVSTFKSFFPDRNLNPKTIRQSVISNWINEKNIPLEKVQLMAGHRWISATIKYRLTPNDDKRALINRFHPLK
jgi:integrase/recombinase XerD